MDIQQAIDDSLERAQPVIRGDRKQMLIVSDIDGDVIQFEFETPRLTYPMMHKTGVQVAYLHPECVVLVTRSGDYLTVAGKTRDDQQEWMLIPIVGNELGHPIPLERVLYQSVDLFWDGVREED